jgi:glycerol-3-phosphate dehydrogenase
MNRMETTLPDFSFFLRQRYLEEFAERSADLLIIGGGITGAGILREAAIRGIRALLVEKDDFGSGTSSRSSKLIHGGLRYLAQGEIRLVKEVSRERTILKTIAPHLVRKATFVIPLYQNSKTGKWKMRLGVWLFDRLAAVPPGERHQRVSRNEMLKAFPHIREKGLVGGIRYYEYFTDDARLTLETVKAAHALGGRAVNYAQAESLLYENGRVAGARIHDRLTGSRYEIRARAVVNAAGPWVDTIREFDRSLTEKRLHLTKGVHLLFFRERFSLPHTLILPVRDGRTIFAIPKGEYTYVGTTDTDYEWDIEKPVATRRDIAYLLDAVNRMFPGLALTEEDVVGTWAGLRPLIHQEGKAPSEISREDEVIISPSGLVSIAGGKLTAFRKMAERVMEALVASGFSEWRKPGAERLSATLPLGGGAVSPQDAKECARRGVTPVVAQRWVERYGSEWRTIESFYQQDEQMRETLDASSAWVKAELAYHIGKEMAVTLQDVLVRRTGYYFFAHDHGLSLAQTVAQAMGQMLGWSEERVKAETESYQAYVRECQEEARRAESDAAFFRNAPGEKISSAH